MERSSFSELKCYKSLKFHPIPISLDLKGDRSHFKSNIKSQAVMTIVKIENSHDA